MPADQLPPAPKSRMLSDLVDGEIKDFRVYACPWCRHMCCMVIDFDFRGHQVACGTCGATGPVGRTPPDAVEFWNSFVGGRRPLPRRADCHFDASEWTPCTAHAAKIQAEIHGQS